jgi:hypothetical protein
MKTAGPLRQRRKFGVAVKRPASLDHPVNVLRCDIPAPCLRYGPPQGLLGTVNKAKATFSPLRCRNRILSSRRQKSMAAEKGGEMRTSLPRTDGQFDFLGLRLRSPQQDREIERLPSAPQSPPITGLPPIAPPTTVSIEAPLTWTTVPSPTLPRPRNAPSVWKRFVIVSAMSALVVGYLTYRSSHGEREMAVPSPFLTAEDVPQPTGLSSFNLEGSAEPEVQTTLLQPSARFEPKPAEMATDAKSPQGTQPTENSATLDETSAISTPNSHISPEINPPDALFDTQKINPKIGGRRVTGSQVSTCYASVSAVRQEHPQAWPAYTLRALGHEGTKCWYPGTRHAAQDHPN